MQIQDIHKERIKMGMIEIAAIDIWFLISSASSVAVL
jgi:hypothetical protein